MSRNSLPCCAYYVCRLKENLSGTPAALVPQFEDFFCVSVQRLPTGAMCHGYGHKLPTPSAGANDL